MNTPPVEDSAKIKVLVTILPQAGYVKAVGGDRVEVFVAVPPGADPHTYDPSARDMVAFSNADLYFTLGEDILPLEDTLASRLSQMNPRMKVIETSEGIVLLTGEEEHGEIQDHAVEAGEHSHEGPDPHIWVSLKNIPIMVNHINDALVILDPAYEPYYKANRDSFLKNITIMDNEVSTMLEKTKEKQFISSHASWGYFARDYGLSQVVIGHPGKEVTSKELEALIRDARSNGISIIVTEPQYSHRAADMISDSINGSVVVADPLAPDMPQELQKFAKLLSGNGLN
ncbi:MAG: zinc ABC transporter substrate-binding protein [Methanoregulaceae archaeon]|nr:zinc ABC transporter substrate-binding protein [Methanoregulaceae archaeon]